MKALVGVCKAPEREEVKESISRGGVR